LNTFSLKTVCSASKYLVLFRSNYDINKLGAIKQSAGR